VGGGGAPVNENSKAHGPRKILNLRNPGLARGDPGPSSGIKRGIYQPLRPSSSPTLGPYLSPQDPGGREKRPPGSTARKPMVSRGQWEPTAQPGSRLWAPPIRPSRFGPPPELGIAWGQRFSPHPEGGLNGGWGTGPEEFHPLRVEIIQPTKRRGYPGTRPPCLWKESLIARPSRGSWGPIHTPSNRRPSLGMPQQGGDRGGGGHCNGQARVPPCPGGTWGASKPGRHQSSGPIGGGLLDP
jgi:hypothetical protein